MNYSRKLFKERAKSVLRVKYWPFFFIGMVRMLISGMLSARINYNDIKNVTNIAAFSSLIGASLIMSIIAGIFLTSPFEVAYKRFLIRNSQTDSEEVKYNMILDIFKENYLKNVKTILFKNLILLLWSIPMIIGLIIMSVSGTLLSLHMAYRVPYLIFGIGCIVFIAGAVIAIYKKMAFYMTEYILAEDFTKDWHEIVAESEEMMKGYKGFTFGLKLSFIGWYLLGILLLGFGTMFVAPYEEATFTQLYLELKNTKSNDYVIIDN